MKQSATINESVFDKNRTTEKTVKVNKVLKTVAPWLAGSGIAVGHILTSSNCTIPQTGQCTSCGSCVVVLGSLVGWAVIKNKNSNQEFFMEETP